MRQNRNNRQQAMNRAWNVQEGYKPSVARSSHTYLPMGETTDLPSRSENLQERLARAVADLRIYATANGVQWASVMALSQDMVNRDWHEDDNPKVVNGMATHAAYMDWVRNA